MRRTLTPLLVAALLIAGPPQGGHYRRIVHAQDDLGSPRSRAQLTFLQINDVYTTVPINDVGGLARVATLKRRLSAGGHPVILALAGDFLSPSVASSVFKGEQMIATLNAAGLDYATLGNHEFDFGIAVLKQRIAESKFTWVISNVLDPATRAPIAGTVPYAVRTAGSLKIGFIGLCLTSAQIAPGLRGQYAFVDPMKAAAQYLPALKREGVDLVVAITHLTFAEDRALVKQFPQIDLVIGGHEHYPITATEDHALISKAGSDAKYAARIDILRVPAATGATTSTDRFFELIPITKDIPDDPGTAAVAASFESRLGRELDTVVGTSTVDLDATGRRLIEETALNNLVADALRADVDADVAISNAGGLRGNRVYPAGPLTRRTLLAMHPFGNIVCKVSVSGRVLLEALNSGVSELPAGAGQFPQVSGVTMTVNLRAPVATRVTNVRVGGIPLDLAKTYTVAMPDFVMNGGDNYAMFAGQKVLVDAQSGDLVVAALEKYVATRRTVSPSIEGRITIVP